MKARNKGRSARYRPQMAKRGFDFGAMFRMADGKIAEWWVTWDNVRFCGNSAICRMLR